MTDMIERMARALCVTTGSNPDAPIPTHPDEPGTGFVAYWTEYVPEARAALLAMREPTILMGQAGFEACRDIPRTGVVPEDIERAYDCWQAMISAALTERKPEDPKPRTDGANVT